MSGFGESRTGPGEGSGRRWRGADGPGGRGGMFEGSEGPERAAGGRYEWRQTRQVLSALFLALLQNPAPWCRGGSNAEEKTGDAGGRQPAHSWTSRTANEHLKAVIWQAPGPSPPLGHYPPEHSCPHGMQTVFRMGWPWAALARPPVASARHGCCRPRRRPWRTPWQVAANRVPPPPRWPPVADAAYGVARLDGDRWARRRPYGTARPGQERPHRPRFGRYTST